MFISSFRFPSIPFHVANSLRRRTCTGSQLLSAIYCNCTKPAHAFPSQLSLVHIHINILPALAINHKNQSRRPPDRTPDLPPYHITLPPKMLITRTFSLTNFLIGTSALTFQIFVLYPWHEKLEEEFTELKKEHARLLEESREKQRNELKGIRQQLEMINAKSGRRGWFW